MAEERLQKYLAAAGIASRRKAEELIRSGRVQVNSATVTELGTKVEPGKDLVTVDGKLVSPNEARAYYLLYKPSGCVTTASDPEGRPTAFEYLRGVPERVFPVGRLDWDAEGAILFTDDGELANRLAHPRFGHRRTYLVKVKGDPAPEALTRMTSGVRLEDGPAQAFEAKIHERVEKNVWVRVVVGEGRFHLVKRLCEAVGLQVQRLFRPEFGGVTVAGLRPGKFRTLEPAEVRRMRQEVGLGDGPAEAAMAMHRSLLPKAARRHGHGPPAPPGSERLDAAAEERRGLQAAEHAAAKPRQHSEARGGQGAAPPRSQQRSRGPRDDSREPQRWPRGPRQDSRGPQESGEPQRWPRGPRQDSRGPRQESRGSRQESRGPQQGPRGPRQDSRGPRQDSRGPRQDSRGPRQESRGPRKESRGPQQGPRRPQQGGEPSRPRGRGRGRR